MASEIAHTPGTLWQKLEERTAHALACGALQPIPTEFTVLDGAEMRFLVRILANLTRKESAQVRQTAAAQRGKPANPFLPYEEDLFVTNLSETHLCLLNKFNVVDRHLLIVTRHYESQDTWLTLGDFAALAMTLAEIPGLGFYNGGEPAGASQHHKHLQLVPLPLAPGYPGLPIDAVIAAAPDSPGTGVLPQLPFCHGYQRLTVDWTDDPAAIAPRLFTAYRHLMTHLGLPLEAAIPAVPYNLLVTRHWMLAIPRSQSSYRQIPVNALGYAGSLLVKNAQGLEQLQRLGPMNLLRAVGVPPAVVRQS